jgi:hypothetical protein
MLRPAQGKGAGLRITKLIAWPEKTGGKADGVPA